LSGSVEGFVQSGSAGIPVSPFTRQGFLFEVSGVAAEKIPGNSPGNNVQNNYFDFLVLAAYPQSSPCYLPDGRQVKEVRYNLAYATNGGTQVSYLKPHTFPAVSVVFPAGCPPAPSPSSFSDEGYIFLPSSLNTKLFHFFAAEMGDPWYESHVLRMLYLSATTITTLGLGDITPVSDFARILIGLEAILGVITIGLFLNAVAQGGSRRNSSRDQS
jgi:hypothetical protein